MGATKVLPPSLLPHRSAAADLHSCALRLRLDPSCMANSAAAKCPSSVRGGEPPAKRVGDAGEPRLAAAVNIGNKKRPSSVRGGETPAKHVGGAGEPHLAAAAVNFGTKKSPSSVRGGDPPAKRVRSVGELYLATAALNFGTKKSPSSVPGGDPPAKRVRGAGEPHLAAAVNIGNKKRPSSVRGGETPAKRVLGVGDPHLAAADNIGNQKRPCPRSDTDPKGSTRRDAAMIKNQSVHLPRRLPESTEQPKPSSINIGELIKKARQAKAHSAAEEAIEIERRRTDARRKVELIVATVEFNDPFLDPADVFMSRDQLREAREVAYAAQARIIEKARWREMEALK